MDVDELDSPADLRRRVDRALIRTEDQETFESNVVDVLAESELYRFAWIGHYDNREDTVRPACAAGMGADYLDEITVTADPDDRLGRGPGGQALRTGEVAVSPDVTEAPSFEPWREAALERDFRSVAATPLVAGDRVHGLLAVYAGQSGVFGDDHRRVLTEIGVNVGHAVANREHRREREQYEMIVETVPDGVFVLDEDATIVGGNGIASEMLGFERDELLGERFERLVEAERVEAAVVDRYTEAVGELQQSDGGQARFEFEATVDGDERVFETHVSLRPFEDEFRGTVGVVRDVTERREREWELERQNARLERFTSVVSHDLRNPLNLASSRLRMAMNTGDEAVAEECFDEVDWAIDRMERLVDELLTLARGGEPVEDPSQVALTVAVEDAWSTTAEGDAELVISSDPGVVVADEGRLLRLLENLFRNAIEHAGPAPRVSVGPTESGFYVADDGPGIPADEHDRVFESGYTTAKEGTGFGLAIVRELAEAHGWSVRVEESVVGGTRFVFSGVDVAGSD